MSRKVTKEIKWIKIKDWIRQREKSPVQYGRHEMIDGVMKELMRGIKIAAGPINQHNGACSIAEAISDAGQSREEQRKEVGTVNVKGCIFPSFNKSESNFSSIFKKNLE